MSAVQTAHAAEREDQLRYLRYNAFIRANDDMRVLERLPHHPICVVDLGLLLIEAQ
jgi:hypothetical protein